MLGQEYIKAEKKDNKTEKKFYDFGPPPDTQTDPPFLYEKKQKPKGRNIDLDDLNRIINSDDFE